MVCRVQVMRVGFWLGLAVLALILLEGSQGQASAQSAAGTEFIFTFESDAQGWVPGFADLPADFDQELFELDSGLRPMPDGLVGNGILLQGHNRSDDLFMFLKKQVDGLRPETAYEVTVSLDLATNVPAGSFGIGGSPGESVYVKAGASTVEPVTQQDDTGHLRMNIDKGNQASEGESMINLGNIANPEVTGVEYKIKTLDNEGRPFKVVSDGEGRVWLIVGTDSGFEGLSAVYYATITYTFSESFEVDGPCRLTRAAQLPIEFEYEGTVPTGFDGINRASCRFTKPVKTVTVTLSGPAMHSEIFTLSEPTTEVPFPLPEGTLSITTLEIVPPGEYQRRMMVTSVGGETLVISDLPGVLKTVTILPAELPNTGDFVPPSGAVVGTVVLGIILASLGTTIVARRRS